jgi:hypothetical protein
MNSLTDPLQNGAIAMPGAHQLTLTGIVFAGEPTKAEFAAISRLALTIEHIQAWVMGDVLVEFVRREQYARAGMTVDTLLSEYALMHGMQVDVARVRYNVAKHYRHVDRTSLSWTHHWFLWGSGQNIAACRRWLAQAREKGWSVEQLRGEFKKQTRPASVSEPTFPSLCPDWLRDAIDHASGCVSEVDGMSFDHASSLLEEAQPLASYIDALRARVATPTKESIKPAA